MAEFDQGERFKFVPFKNQPDYPTWEEKLAHPKVHRICFPVDFSDLTLKDIGSVECEYCHHPFVRVVKDFTRGWGDVERLVGVVPDVPQIECGCKLFTHIEWSVRERLDEFYTTMRRILRAIEAFPPANQDSKLLEIKDVLAEDDYKKVEDFIVNHIRTEAALVARLKAEQVGKN